ncbi:DUF2461 domain-containing protein [Dokdonella sp.]|uniref:DUF2461 domain-containing protein n=1 Tax=Dokdonella sp. TaxID=2291710 RepID=UPI003AF63AF9
MTVPPPAAPMTSPYFTPATFAFFRTLAAHNTRAWFDAHRSHYETQVREPYLRLIRDLQPALAAISPHYRADPRRQGGSLYRIYRDTRYRRDKSPYKTWQAARFAHERRGEVEAPAFYLHIAADECLFGAGFWHPSSPTLRRFRDFVVDNPATWQRITRAPAFTRRYEFVGDSLKRAPQGQDPAHPLIGDLKRKDWVVSRPFDASLACSDALLPWIEESMRDTAPLVDYLCAALDLPF